MKTSLFSTILAIVLLVVIGLSSQARANIVTYEGDSLRYDNCIPFGCGAGYFNFVGYGYGNIDAFNLQAGDTIGFDLTNGTQSFTDLTLFIAAADENDPTVLNGGFVEIASLYATTGDNQVGNYETVFTLTNAFDFSGGNLVLGFLRGDDHAPQNAGQGASMTDGGTNADGTIFRGRYFMNNVAMATSYSPVAILNFQINSQAVSAPISISLFALGLLGLASRRLITVS